MKRLLFSMLAVAVTLLPVTGSAQSSAPLITLKVGVVPIEAAAEVYYAQDMGFFKKQGLEVEIQTLQNGAAVGAAVAGGSLDIGYADTLSIANGHARGLPFTFIAPAMLNTYAAPTLALMVNGNGPIREASDLNNKTIAVNGINNITMLPFEVWIDKNGGDSKTVKWIEVPIPAANDTIVANKVDGGTLGEPFISFGVEKGLRPLYVQKNGLSSRYLLGGYMTTKEWLSKNAATSVKFAKAIKEAGEWSNANRAATVPILAKYTKIPIPVVEQMRRGIYASELQPSDLQPMIDAAAKYGILPKPFPAAELFSH